MSNNFDLPAFAAHLGSRIIAPVTCDGAGGPAWDDPIFNHFALDLFHLQFSHNPGYRRFCEAHGTHPGSLCHWTSIPAIPTDAFKELMLTSIPETERTTVFHSSGTTGQTPSRHFHSAASLGLYETSLWSWFVPHLLRPGCHLPAWLLILTPRRPEAPASSLVHMFECIASRLNSDTLFACRTARDGGWEIEGQKAANFLRHAAASGKPGLILTTAFGLVQLSDLLASEGLHFALPPGSRVMETGGYKGRTRTLPKPELHQEISRRLGVPADCVVTEYGMSELSSQAYDQAAGDLLPPAGRVFRFPPWARAQVVSPETAREVADGETGLIRVLDLANVFSVAAIQTGDLGVRRGGGFALIGRAENREPRGCSLMVIS